uniref:hypothetical protein n=1 Tax=Cohnella sp. REN36 TaxID=2887347 RepID=UPI001D14F945
MEKRTEKRTGGMGRRTEVQSAAISGKKGEKCMTTNKLERANGTVEGQGMNAAMEVREAVAARPKPGRGTEGKRLVRAAEAKLLREDGLAEIRGAKLAGGKRPVGRIAVRATVVAPMEAARSDALPRSIKLPGAVLAALLGDRLEAGERGLTAPAEPAASGGARAEAQAPEARRVKGFTP